MSDTKREAQKYKPILDALQQQFDALNAAATRMDEGALHLAANHFENEPAAEEKMWNTFKLNEGTALPINPNPCAQADPLASYQAAREHEHFLFVQICEAADLILRHFCREYGINTAPFDGTIPRAELDNRRPGIVRDVLLAVSNGADATCGPSRESTMSEEFHLPPAGGANPFGLEKQEVFKLRRYDAAATLRDSWDALGAYIAAETKELSDAHATAFLRAEAMQPEDKERDAAIANAAALAEKLHTAIADAAARYEAEQPEAKKQIAAITHAARSALQTARKYLDAEKHAAKRGKATSLSAGLWHEAAGKVNELRQRLSDAGCFDDVNVWQFHMVDKTVCDALRTLAEEVGADPVADFFLAGKQWDVQGLADLLVSVVNTLDGFLGPPAADNGEAQPGSAAEPTPAKDDSAYRPASEFIDSQRFPTLKAIRKALTANPAIRTRRPTGKSGKPIQNRLNIHAGDWHEFKNRPQAVDPLDLPATVVDAVMETEQRKADIRNKAGK